MTDWLPTLYSAAGGDAAADLPTDLDGVDQWASLVEAREPSARQVGVEAIHFQINNVRQCPHWPTAFLSFLIAQNQNSFDDHVVTRIHLKN